MSNTTVHPTASAVNPTALSARGFSFGDRVSITAPGYFNGQRGTVRNSFVAGGIRSYYVMLADGIVAFDWYELVEA